jgi:quinohemoprotein ethanol dehydrogenase
MKGGYHGGDLGGCIWCLAAVGAQQLAAVDAASRAAAGGVTAQRIVAAASDPTQWLSTGRGYDEQRFSPLAQINTANAAKLGLAWYSDLDTARGQEATPLMVDGKLFVSTAWSMVKAFDARTGKLLWSYDPKVPRETLVKACCDAVNRGVAAWGNKIYVGTLDGRLIALDAATGKPAWSVVTVDQSKAYTITGAPRIIKGRVIIGNGGAEYGVRGYVTAYDAASGKQLWRFYTVPGDPAKGPEPAYLQEAAKTWTGEYWKLGGGGTVWDSMAYDPDLDLLYIGVGNGSPWNQKIRSPGGGDNLYLSSVVALKPETGDYAWHFQETPAESWDFTASQHIVLANLTIDGKPRKVLMHAPKNGFFYVIDRTNGQFISAKNYAPVTWAKSIDPKTGRPDVNPDSRYALTGKPVVQMPGPSGAHSWHPMAFDPKHGLVFIPAQIAAFPYVPSGADLEGLVDRLQRRRRYGRRRDARRSQGPRRCREGDARRADRVGSDQAAGALDGRLSLGQQWRRAGNRRRARPAGRFSKGHFNVYAAADGKKLWSMPVQTGVMAAPITYSIGGAAICRGDGGLGWRLLARAGRGQRPDPQHQPAARVQARRHRQAARRAQGRSDAARSAAGHRHGRADRARGGSLRPLLRCVPWRCRGCGPDRARSAPQPGAQRCRRVAVDHAGRRAQGERHGLVRHGHDARPKPTPSAITSSSAPTRTRRLSPRARGTTSGRGQARRAGS